MFFECPGQLVSGSLSFAEVDSTVPNNSLALFCVNCKLSFEGVQFFHWCLNCDNMSTSAFIQLAQHVAMLFVMFCICFVLIEPRYLILICCLLSFGGVFDSSLIGGLAVVCYG